MRFDRHFRRSLSSSFVFSTMLPCAAFSSEAGTAAKPTSTQQLKGEGKTLPQGVMRLRTVFRAAQGQTGFDSLGKKEESGFKAQATASAFVVEYGVTPRLSMQVLVPFVHANRLGMDGSAFQNSSFYAEKYDEFLKKSSVNLVKQKLCSDVAACVKAIQEKNLSLPLNSSIILPTGETLDVRAGVPIKTVASALVVNAAVPTSGRTGLGDIEIGGLYALADRELDLNSHWPVQAAVGVGLRLPSGSFSDVPAAQRGTGRGSTDLGLRLNIDKFFTDEFIFSWQNQSEMAIISGKKKRSSLLNNTILNSADPQIAGGDGQRNEGEFKRSSLRQVGFLKLIAGAGMFSSSMALLSLNGQFKYDFDSPGAVDGTALGKNSVVYSTQVGMSIDGLRVAWPVQLDVDYEIPLAGSNKTVVTRNLSTTLKAYYRF